MINVSRKMEEKILEYKIIDDRKPAFYSNDKNAGLVLYSRETKWIWPWKITDIALNAAISLPNDTFGLITTMSNDKGIKVISDAITANWVGTAFVKAHRIGLLPRKIKEGTEIAKLTVVPYSECHLVNLDS